MCIGQDILLEKLKFIDISKNEIHCKDINDFKNIELFINNYQKLKKIKIQKNDFIEELIELYNTKKEEVNEIISKIKSKDIKFYVDSQYKEQIEDKLNDIIDYKDKL